MFHNISEVTLKCSFPYRLASLGHSSVHFIFNKIYPLSISAPPFVWPPFCSSSSLAVPCSLQDLISLTRDWTPAPNSESKFLTTGSPGSSPPPWSFCLYFLILMNHVFGLCVYHCWLPSGVKTHLTELVQQIAKLPPIPASALPCHLGILLNISCFLLNFFSQLVFTFPSLANLLQPLHPLYFSSLHTVLFLIAFIKP